jgi:hypothetical protein
MLSQNYIKINSSLKTYILNSINSSIHKKLKFILETKIKEQETKQQETKQQETKHQENNYDLYCKNNVISNNNISGFVFFLSLSIMHLVFLNKK